MLLSSRINGAQFNYLHFPLSVRLTSSFRLLIITDKLGSDIAPMNKMLNRLITTSDTSMIAANFSKKYNRNQL